MDKTKRIRKFSRKLRKNLTNTEKVLKMALYSSGIRKEFKCKVKYQFPIYPYIMDFFIPQYGVVIEADGGIHSTSIEYDSRRDNYLENLGLLVIRLDNYLIEAQLESVISLIKEAIKQRKGYKESIKYKINHLEASGYPERNPKGRLILSGLKDKLKRV